MSHTFQFIFYHADRRDQRKRTLRQKIKIAQRNFTVEANQSEKQIIQCEGKSKEGRLNTSTRNHLRSNSELSQEWLLRQLAVVTGELEELLCMCGNLGSADKEILDNWIDDLARELGKQGEAVSEAIEELRERGQSPF